MRVSEAWSDAIAATGPVPAGWSVASVGQTAQTCQRAATSHLAAANTARKIPAIADLATTPATTIEVSTETTPKIKLTITGYLCGVAVCKISGA